MADELIFRNLKIPPEELEVHVEESEDTYFIVRALHKPTMTLKISDWWPMRDDALKQVAEELEELLKDRLQGLGKK